MAIYIEMHISHVNFKNIYKKYSATNKTLLSADIYMIHPTSVYKKVKIPQCFSRRAQSHRSHFLSFKKLMFCTLLILINAYIHNWI